MGRNLNKCRRLLPEVAEAELPALIGDGGVTSTTPEKRSRDGQLDFASDSAFAELRSGARRRVMIEEAATKSLSPADGLADCGALTAVEETNCSSEPASCCSSDASVQLVSTIADPTGQTESAQLETLTFSGGRYNRSEAIPSSSSCAEESGEMEPAVAVAAARPLGEANSRFKSAVNETPSKVEIEDFFASAEKDLHKRFSEKYNFDVEKGVPMKGRYEWVPVKP